MYNFFTAKLDENYLNRVMELINSEESYLKVLNAFNIFLM